ncbi:MAG: hypothetical protein Kow00127_09290 [Bacteroidales bacterium]
MEDHIKAPSYWNTVFTYGLGTGVVLVIIGLASYVLDVNTFENRWTQWIGYIFLFAGMTMAAVQYRNQVAGGTLSYGRSFSVHFWTGLTAGVIASIFLAIFMTFAGDEIRQMAMDKAEEEVLRRNPEASDQEIEMALKMTGMFLKPGTMALMGLISYAVISVVYGLISSIFVKKESSQVVVEETTSES